MNISQIRNGRKFTQPISDADRLISALREGFEELGRKHEEHANRFEKAVDALRIKPAVTDTKTAFWTAYKTLADEHDKEFQQKYSTDLDTSLIFAGLFSAISSAFIIEIQPELRQGPDNPAPRTLVVVAQGFLYISLFSTLLVALLAVLGKQWIMHYVAAGSRGTLEERGVERQRKTDGLAKWKFDMVMQMFPLLLQLGLLLFSIALSLYLWTVHSSIAGIVLTFTSMGIIAYFLLLISAIQHPDSPFQTPLADVLIGLMEMGRTSPQRLKVITRHAGRRLQYYAVSAWNLIRPNSHSLLLPIHIIRTKRKIHHATPPTSSKALLDEESFPDPSPAIPAVLWVLETTTNPDLVSATAAMAVDLQWPLGLDLTLPLHRLKHNFMGCFDSDRARMSVRDGMVKNAVNCGQAYCVLNINSRGGEFDYQFRHHLDEISFQPSNPDDNSIQNAELRSVINAMKCSAKCFRGKQISGWALRVMPHRLLYSWWLGWELKELLLHFSLQAASLTTQHFADYLLCMSVFLGFQPHQRDVARRHKRDIDLLLITLLEILGSRMTEVNMLEPGTAAEVMHLTVRIAITVEYKPSSHANTQIYNFCAMLPNPGSPVWTKTVLSALTLAKRGDGKSADVVWIYRALEYFQWAGTDEDQWTSDTASAIGELLLALAGSEEHPRPSDTMLRVILEALSQPPAAYPAFLFLCRSDRWFLDSDLRAMMQKHSVWEILGETTLRDTGRMANDYIEMGDKLSKLAEWKPHIQRDPAGWISVYSQMDPSKRQRRQRHQFQSVLRRVWDASGPALLPSQEDDEYTLILQYDTLSKIWGQFDFSETVKPEDFFRLARCTASTALRGHYTHSQYPFSSRNQPPDMVVQKQISADFKHRYFKPLVDALAVAAGNVNSTITVSLSGGLTPSDILPQNGQLDLESAAIILAVMGKILAAKELEQRGIVPGKRYWEDLRKHVLQEIEVWEYQSSTGFSSK